MSRHSTMKPKALLSEAVAIARTSKVSSVLTLAVVAAMCVVALLTVGRSASAVADVAAQMEQAGAQRLTITDNGEGGFINPTNTTAICNLNTVTSGTALGSAFDTVNGPLGAGSTKTVTYPVIGDVSSVATIVRGRLPQVGEAIISATKLSELGFQEPLGYVMTTDGTAQYPIVGAFTPKTSFEDLAAGIIVSAPLDTPGRELRVLITDITAAAPTVQAVLSILAPTDTQNVNVESPTSIAETAKQLSAQLASSGRIQLLIIMAAGGFFVAAVVLSDVLVKRRDLGRRRTLGITRADLALLVTLRTGIIAVLGAVLGCLIGWMANRILGIATPLAFTAATGILATLVAAIASIPPAGYAAHLDPVTVMRTP